MVIPQIAMMIPDLEEEEEEEMIRQVAEAPTQAHAIPDMTELEGGAESCRALCQEVEF